MRALLFTVLVALAATSCGSGDQSSPGSSPAPDERPNVIVIVIDTLRADRLSAYGYERPTSPRLERLANEGALFEDVTSQSSWTLPSMVSMFQSRYITSYRDVYLQDAPTLAEAFQGAGYRTIGIVGNGLLSEQNGFGRGFDHYDARRPFDDQGNRTSAARNARQILDTAAAPVERALATQEGGERVPLLLYLHFMDPHGPYQHYPRLESDLPVESWADAIDLSRQRELFPTPASPERVAKVENAWRAIAESIARYDQEIRHTDEHLQELLTRLDELGALENAVVAVVADHGECLWAHRSPNETRNKKSPPTEFFFQSHGQQVFQEIVFTPMILWGRGVPAGTRIAQPVENVDLYPTLLELAGIERVEGLHGKSLVPALAAGRDQIRDVFTAVVAERSVREGATGWKLILPTAPFAERGVRLFQLVDDPAETRNLAAEQPEVVERLTRLLDEWAERFPTETSLGRPKSEQTMQDMRELGYAGDDEDDEESGQDE